MKLKIIKANNLWWYNKFLGKEFDVLVFGYYKNGYNHKQKN